MPENSKLCPIFGQNLNEKFFIIFVITEDRTLILGIIKLSICSIQEVKIFGISTRRPSIGNQRDFYLRRKFPVLSEKRPTFHLLCYDKVKL